MRLTLLYQTALLLVFCLIYPHLNAQQDLNHFVSLKSVGQMPTDFSMSIEEKVRLDKQQHPEDYKSPVIGKYVIKLFGSVSELLHSGKVIYGDEMTQYVNKIADRVLKNEPTLRKELRFYVIKSNVSNALSTNEGVIFITTGLLSQLSSEAQLAFIISHEIVHYQENHLIKAYDKRLKNKGMSYDQMAAYSKENELEADLKGIKLYCEAGYSQNELIGTFDVLLYSHLPFDEIAVDPNYLSGGKIKITAEKFGEKSYPILAVDDYDDKKSSHPNIKKRKEAVTEEIKKFSNWKNNVYYESQEDFIYVRNLARFEAVRTDIIEMNLSNALYDIYLLEREFPNSEYLQQMKALSWLGILQLTQEGRKSKFIPASSKFEGEIGKLHDFFKKASKDELVTFAIRNIYDICKADDKDVFRSAIINRMNESLRGKSTFSWGNYSPLTLEAYLAKKAVTDSLAPKDETSLPKETNSKYDRIKSKKVLNSNSDIDTSQYFIFGLYDVLADSAFLKTYESTPTYNNEDSKVDLSRLQLNTIELTTKATTTTARREKVMKNYIDALNEVELGDTIPLSMVQPSDIQNPTEQINTKNLFLGVLEETANYENIHFLPVDYYILEEFKSKSDATAIGFTEIRAFYQPEIEPTVVIYGLVLVVTAPLILLDYIPAKLMQGYTTRINMLTYDLKSGTVKGSSYVFLNKPTKMYFKRHLERMLSNLNTTN